MKVLVTSALPYVNNVPHLGNIVCVISADVYKRYLKSTGTQVVSVLGTDEHGTTTEVKAIEEGVTPRQLVDKYFAIHQNIYKWFNTDFDCFGRTSDKENFDISQDIFLKLHQNGYIIEQTITQMWDDKAQKFLADRFIEGTCPNCGYPEARGDQCEKCGKLLNPEDLRNPKSKLTGTTPVPKQTKHLFIDLTRLEPELKTWIQEREENWSANARTTTHAWLREGLKPRAITRDLEWGIPVPLEGFDKKVFYSWFDAPIGYISITAHSRPDWQQWWKSPQDTRLVQFMGKDNIPFHTILFPAFCIGAKDNYTLMDSISVNEYLNYENGKFSKSRGQGVFGDDAMATGIPADNWRYYIIANRPEREDTTFDWSDFQEKINKELLGNFGNLVNRTLTFINRFYDSTVPAMAGRELQHEYREISESLEAIELRRAIKQIMTVSRNANQYFQDNEPWRLIKEDKARADTVIGNLTSAVKDLAILIQPFMPQVSAEIFVQLNLPQQTWNQLGQPVPGGHKIGTAKPLFRKLEDSEVKSFRERFQGKKPAASTIIPVTQNPSSDADILDLKVAEILEVTRHPDAEKLYIERISLGTEERTIVSGLAGHYTPEELVGKKVIVVTNLKPAKLRGVLSQGMLLAAGDKQVGLLLAPHAQPGQRVAAGKSAMQDAKKEITIDQFLTVEIAARGGRAFVGSDELMVLGKPVQVDRQVEGKVR